MRSLITPECELRNGIGDNADTSANFETGMNTMAPNPVVLITGAARRIGAVIARALHAAGYDIALHYRASEADARALNGELEGARSGSVLCLRQDLADIELLPDLIAATVARFGRFDALINNASAFYPTAVGGTSAAQWNELFASNAQAPFFLSQAAAPHLRESHGCIVNLVDLYAQRPLAGHTVYCMAKAALVMMTQSLAKELAPEIRVNGIAPGAVLWPESGKPAVEQAAMIARTPLQRAGTPDDISRAVLFLVRDAPFITGQILRVDGGRSL
jgi:pteridine reductase